LNHGGETVLCDNKAGSSFVTQCGVQIGLETGLTELLRDKTML